MNLCGTQLGRHDCLLVFFDVNMFTDHSKSMKKAIQLSFLNLEQVNITLTNLYSKHYKYIYINQSNQYYYP